MQSSSIASRNLLAWAIFLPLALLVAASFSAAEELVYFDAPEASGTLVGGASSIEAQSELMSTVDGNEILAVELDTVLSNGNSANRVDLVFLGDGYTTSELAAFKVQVDSLLANLLSESPLAEYQSYFNAHRIDLVSPQSGIDHDPSLGVLKDTALDMQFWCHESESTLCVDVSKAISASALAPDADQIIVLANSGKVGGAAYPYSDLSLVSGLQIQGGENLLHQFGHAFANLADEYDTGSWPEYVGSEPAEPNVSALTLQEMSFQKIKWHAWLGENPGEELGGAVGIYEGAMQHRYNIYRPSLNSKMRSLGQPFNMPSIESFIKEIYRIVDPIDDSTDTTKTWTGSDELEVVPLEPTDHELSIQWAINGNPVPGATTRKFRVDGNPYPDGTYEVSVTVVDNTPWVRDEVARKQWMTSSRKWTVVVDQKLARIVTEPQDETVNVGQRATFGVVAERVDSYQWYKGNQAISGANSNVYMTPPAQHSDDMSQYWVKVTNVAGSTNSSKATLTVLNRLPKITKPANVTMYRGESRIVSPAISDADGDSLTLSASTPSAQGLPEDVLSVSGNVITIKPGNTYLGTFPVTIRASDGFGYSEEIFEVTVANRAPVLASLTGRSMHWKEDKIEVPLYASDADGDNVSLSASLLPGSDAPVSLSLTGSTLTVNPQAGYLGTFVVSVKATDGMDEDVKSLTVSVYNSTPVITPISLKSMHYKEDSLQVMLSASDADGDPVVFTAELASGSPSDATLSLDGNILTVNPADGFLGFLAVKVIAADEKDSSSTVFTVKVYNLAPSLQTIPEQRMHWREKVREVIIVGSDSDGEGVSFSAKLLPGCAIPLGLSVSGNILQISAPGDELGSCQFEVSVSDGLLQTTKSSRIEIYDNAPDLGPIEDQNIARSEILREVLLSVTDQDPDPHTFSAEIVNEKTALNLDAAYNFKRYKQSWHYDLNGLKGKYFLGTQEDREDWFVILPDGKLYQWKGELGASVLLGELPLAYYEMPELLFDVAEMSPAEAVSISFDDYTMKIAPRENARGTFEVKVTVSDGKKTDSETFLLTLYDQSIRLDLVRSQSRNWKEEGLSQIELSAGLADSSAEMAEISFEGEYFLETEAYELDKKHHFSLLGGYDENPEEYPYNLLGQFEKYIEGTNDSGQRVSFVITPMGDLFELTGNLEQSRKVAILAPAYYQDTSLLFGVPPPPVFPAISLSSEENVLSILPQSGLIGRFLLTAIAREGAAVDEEIIIFSIDNQAPELEEIVGRKVGRFAEYASIPVSASDPDNDPLTLAVNLGGYEHLVYELAQDYAFQANSGQQVDPENPLSHNRYGWREKHFSGVVNGQGQEFIILPNGEIRLWSGSVATSQIIERVGSSYYAEIEALFNPSEPTLLPPVDLSFDGQTIELQLPLSFYGSFPITTEATDGGLYDDETFFFTKANWAPFIYPIDPVRIHWRTDSVDVPIEAVDADNDTLEYQAELYDMSQVWLLDQAHDFSPLAANWQFNKNGKEGKYFQGKDNGQYSEYVIRPVYSKVSGALLYAGLYHYTGNLETSPMLASLPEAFYQDPTLLFDIEEPGSFSPAELSFVDNILTINPRDKYKGSFVVTVSVSDSYTTVRKTLLVQVYNNLPELEMVGNQQISWTDNGLRIPLLSSDVDEADRSYLVHDARLISTGQDGSVELPDLRLEIIEGELLIQQPQGFTGIFTIAVSVTDGLDWDEVEFQVTVTNSPPTISNIPNSRIHWREDFRDIPLVASDPDGDEIEFEVEFDSGFSPAVSLEVSGSTLRIDPEPGYLGNFYLLVRASDGTSTVQTKAFVQVYNAAPVLAEIGSKSLGRNDASLSLLLSAHDADKDPLSFSASLSQDDFGKGTLDLDGNTLRFFRAEGFLGSVQVNVKVTDGLLTDSETFTISVTNRAPVIAPIPAQTMGWKEGVRSIPFSASDPDQDSLEFSARIVSTDNPGHISIEQQNIVFELREGYLGSFSVELSASDGIETAKRFFSIAVQNTAPVFGSLDNQYLNLGEKTRELELQATDADGDELSFSANVPDLYREQGSVSLQGNMLTIVPADRFVGSFQVKLAVTDGLATTQRTLWVVVQNEKPNLHAIPAQKMHWAESFLKIPLIVEDEEPELLKYTATISQGSPFPVQFEFEDSQLVVRLTEPKLGQLTIKVDVSDGFAFDSKSFTLDVVNTAPYISQVPTQHIQKGVPSFDVQIDIFDPDGDEIVNSGVEVVDTNRIAYELDAKHNFELRWGSYYPNSLGNNEKYFQGSKNEPRGLYWYVIFPNGDLFEWKGKLSTSILIARLPKAFYQDPSLLFDTEEPTFSGAPAWATLSGDRISIVPDPDYVGEFYLKVTAEDRMESTEMMFSVLVAPDGDSPTGPGECQVKVIEHDGEYEGAEANVSFTAEGRIGDSATGPGNRTFELDISRSTSGPFSNGETANYVWKNGKPTAFKLRYEASTKTARLEVGGVLVSHRVLDNNAFTDILIRARAAVAGAKMEVSSLVINGQEIEGQAVAIGSELGVKVLQITRGMLSQGFELEGVATMTWREGNGANLVKNGSFETPVVTAAAGWDVFTEEQLGGWKVAWMNPETACPSGSPVTAPVLELQRSLLVPAQDGMQYAELDSDCHGPNMLAHSEKTTVRIWQDIETVPGRTYDFSFYGRRRPGSSDDKRITVKWGDKEILTNRTLPETWNRKRFSVVAKTSLTRIEFSDVGVPDTLGVFIDNVQVIDPVIASPPKNSELAFQISLANVQGHETDCPAEGEDPDDDDVQCDTRKLITSPVYTLWNSFLGMVNILELVNPTTETINVKVSFYSIAGELTHQQVFAVPAENQYDLILNQLPGYISNSYGVVKLEFQGLLDGRMMYYRQASTGDGYDFVFGFALEDPMSGRTAVSFNTFQPSYKAEERNNVVANWLTIVNLEERGEDFTVLSYDQSGTLLLKRRIRVPSFGRVDIDGGHDLAGPSVVGSHIILPENDLAKYISLLTRFGGNAAAGFVPSEYRFAFPLMARKGATQEIFAPITNRFDEFNWLEVVNILDQEVRAAVSLYSSEGTLLESMELVLPANGQRHLDAASFVGAGRVGYAMVLPKTPGSIVAQSMVYFREAATGSVTSLYGSQARRAYPCSVAGSYNLFLGMENYLSVVNPSDEEVAITVLLTGPDLRQEKKLSVRARESLNLAVHDPELFLAIADSYGLVSVKTNGAGKIFSELVRVRWRAEGVADFAVPTAVR